MNSRNRVTLIEAGRRFLLASGAIFLGLAGGLLGVMTLLPGTLGTLNSFSLSYVLTTSAIGAAAFGGLYAAAGALRTPLRIEEEAMGGTRRQ